MVGPVFKKLALASALAMVPGLALAHTVAGQTSGFLHGFSHPISGLDHILAMVLVGMFAFQLGGRALWMVPATFVLLMAAGGFVGMAGVQLPFVEIGIALSVIVLGAVVAFRIQAPVAMAMAVVGLFAVFHGHAHGVEMPTSASSLEFAAGFMLATALLHIAGIGVGFVIVKISEARGPLVARMAGGLASIAGVGLLTGLI